MDFVKQFVQRIPTGTPFIANSRDCDFGSDCDFGCDWRSLLTGIGWSRLVGIIVGGIIVIGRVDLEVRSSQAMLLSTRRRRFLVPVGFSEDT